MSCGGAVGMSGSFTTWQRRRLRVVAGLKVSDSSTLVLRTIQCAWTEVFREEGGTIAEIAKATGWQNHTIRGFISGTVTKKMGLTVESVKDELGDRTYRLS